LIHPHNARVARQKPPGRRRGGFCAFYEDPNVGSVKSDGWNGPAINDKLGTVDCGGAIRGQIGDEIGDFVWVGWTADRNPAQAVEDDLPRVFDRAAVCGLYPDMHVDLVTEGRLVDVVADGFDLGVRVAHLVPTDMITVSLGRPQRYAVVASSDYVKRHGRPRVPPDLLHHKCIRVRLPDGALFRWRFEKDGESIQIDAPGHLTLDEVNLSRIAVTESVGIGYFMEQSVMADVEAKRFVRLLEDWTPSFSGLCLYYPGRRNPSAGLKAFLALAREMASLAVANSK
jgi:hypothetical protein